MSCRGTFFHNFQQLIMNILLLVTPCYRSHSLVSNSLASNKRWEFSGSGTKLPILAYKLKRGGLSVQRDAIFRDSATDVANLVGAQAALVSHHVWHRVGSRFSVAAGGIGRRFPLGQPARVELAGRRHHVRLPRARPRGRRQHEFQSQLQPHRPGLSRHRARSSARAGGRSGTVAAWTSAK